MAEHERKLKEEQEKMEKLDQIHKVQSIKQKLNRNSF